MYETAPEEIASRMWNLMDAIELQFLPGTPDDPDEIDRRLKELRGDVDE
jgi:hypothetical protein